MQIWMPGSIKRETGRDLIFVLVSIFLTILFFIIPNGFEGASQTAESERARGKVVEVNNERLINIGPVKQGEQQLEVEIRSGRFKGQIFSGSNNLIGKIEMDKLFAPGDSVLVVISISEDGAMRHAQVYDHYRTGKTVFLCLLFFFFIVLIMGWMGIKILISFVFTAVVLIRVLFPAMLRGWDPIFASVILVTILTAVIIFLVGGITRRGLTAFAGSMGGVLLTSCLAFFFTYWFKIHGAVRPFAEALLYSGYTHLNLVHLFVSGIFLASSGAMMDLSMDIASAMDEIKKQYPAISRFNLIKSGVSVSRHVAGTMSTTLLLAYSAEYTAMVMTFIAQGIPPENVINLVWVSSEVVHTLVGCFGLVLVAPLTVFAGGIILGGQDRPR
ncbi:MAG: YibE/F family protein [Spirochaetaceae bacterium]|nr:YibE/F family protein [Spirochaetaceae bacterium]